MLKRIKSGHRRVAGYGFRVPSSGFRVLPTAYCLLPIVYCLLPTFFLRAARYGFQITALSLLLTACGKSLPTIEGVDLTKWKNDKNGCNGLREEMTEFVIKQKDKLLSLSETDIVRLLGKPDETELYKRNEKFYKYYFSNGPGCAHDGDPKSMTLRFNAVGLLKETVVN